MTQITIPTVATPDPTPPPPANISGDANNAQVDPNKAANTPAEKLILGKYKTQADLEAAHVALEKKLGEKNAAAEITQEQAREAVVKAGLDMAAISTEYSENNGKLTEKTIKALEAQGITRETVNTYVNGLQAQATQMRQEFAQIAGSEDVLKSVLEWAATNGDPAAVKTYNDAVVKGDTVVAKLALQSLGNSYNDAVGTDPALLNGDLGVDSGVAAYASSAQVVEAMSNPKYASDPAYRADVERRMAKTNFFSVRSSNR